MCFFLPALSAGCAWVHSGVDSIQAEAHPSSFPDEDFCLFEDATKVMTELRDCVRHGGACVAWFQSGIQHNYTQ